MSKADNHNLLIFNCPAWWSWNYLLLWWSQCVLMDIKLLDIYIVSSMKPESISEYVELTQFSKPLYCAQSKQLLRELSSRHMCHRVMETSTVRLSSQLGTSGHCGHTWHLAITYTCNNIAMEENTENRAVNGTLRIFANQTTHWLWSLRTSVSISL